MPQGLGSTERRLTLNLGCSTQDHVTRTRFPGPLMPPGIPHIFPEASQSRRQQRQLIPPHPTSASSGKCAPQDKETPHPASTPVSRGGCSPREAAASPEPRSQTHALTCFVSELQCPRGGGREVRRAGTHNRAGRQMSPPSSLHAYTGTDLQTWDKDQEQSETVEGEGAGLASEGLVLRTGPTTISRATPDAVETGRACIPFLLLERELHCTSQPRHSVSPCGYGPACGM